MAYIPSMCSILLQKHLRWLGHVSCTGDDQIPTDMLSSELTMGTVEPDYRPSLCFKDVCKRDMKSDSMDTSS